MRHFCSLSEAIRFGASLRPKQAFHKFYDEAERATCANGAALEAIFEEPPAIEWFLENQAKIAAVFRSDFSYLVGSHVSLSCGCGELTHGPENAVARDGKYRLDDIVVHLNNHHHWTREQIADWLESEEEKLGFVTLIETEDRIVV